MLETPPLIIFVTAFGEFAVKAFEVHALDYLLKPFGRERFQKALTRARNGDMAAKLRELIAHLQERGSIGIVLW